MARVAGHQLSGISQTRIPSTYSLSYTVAHCSMQWPSQALRSRLSFSMWRQHPTPSILHWHPESSFCRIYIIGKWQIASVPFLAHNRKMAASLPSQAFLEMITLGTMLGDFSASLNVVANLQSFKKICDVWTHTHISVSVTMPHCKIKIKPVY